LLLEHFLYASTPKKGQPAEGEGGRAHSSGAVEGEFYEAVDRYWVPFTQSAFENGDLEGRVVSSVSGSGKVYLSRVFWGSRLDEFGRDGFVSHVVAVPRDAFLNGLQFSAIERAFATFWQENEKRHKQNHEIPTVPIGSIPEFELEWSDSDARDIGRLRQLVPRKDQVEKIVGAFAGKETPKALILLDGDYHDRIAMTYAFANMLINSGATGFRATSECPQVGILDWYANLVVSSYLPSLSATSGWLVMKPRVSEGKLGPFDAQKMGRTLEDVYR